MIISHRFIYALREEHTNVLDQKRALEKQIEQQEKWLGRDSEQDEKIEAYIDTLRHQLTELEMQARNFESPKVVRLKNEDGFYLGPHAVTRYNNRYTPELDEKTLMDFLVKMDVANRIRGDRNQDIKLFRDFTIAVQDRYVISFKYDVLDPNREKVDISQQLKEIMG